ncbi:type II toxin-antitoxin system HicB family antitoxin [Iningainema tapete]|uniref:2-oxoisovalerate dehydrogenase E1 subunit beta n=1 Tax=Iningainema tapete BLCC-T55 TaxID=2748662 RepID=A0A8J6XSE7_9CYAN|nr:2-oxoisovalerate dehydrogenase E1 subunit beta [Iningainema tapete]MBD2777484.1 2-oxoisovalerate dehydrogenase E1 subunit beta [Iningainema tapete BLCC-T55]
MTEIVFLVEDDPDGGYTARALGGESIFTQADDLKSLREMVRDAVHCHFPENQTRPKIIHLHQFDPNGGIRQPMR